MKLKVKRVAKDAYEVSFAGTFTLETLGTVLARFLPVPALFVLGGRLEKADLTIGHSLEVDV